MLLILKLQNQVANDYRWESWGMEREWGKGINWQLLLLLLETWGNKFDCKTVHVNYWNCIIEISSGYGDIIRKQPPTLLLVQDAERQFVGSLAPNGSNDPEQMCEVGETKKILTMCFKQVEQGSK